MISNHDITQVLTQALPYIHEFHNKTIVIKYGGNAMIDETLQQQFASDIALLRAVGMNPIIVHGGGPQIGNYLQQLNIESQFVNGMRISDQKTVEVAEMVLGGSVNKHIVNLIQQAGGNAIGLSGKDGNLLLAEKLPLAKDATVDPGFVGQVSQVNSQLINTLINANYIPVIAPIGIDHSGQTWNINADLCALSVATALKAEKLLLLTNTPGVLDLQGELIACLNPKQVDQLIANKTIIGGMLPKITCAIEALKQGVHNVQIIDGRLPHSVLLELFTNEGVGTLIHLSD